MIIKETIIIGLGQLYIEVEDTMPSLISIAQDEAYHPITFHKEEWASIVKAVEKVIKVAERI